MISIIGVFSIRLHWMASKYIANKIKTSELSVKFINSHIDIQTKNNNLMPFLGSIQSVKIIGDNLETLGYVGTQIKSKANKLIFVDLPNVKWSSRARYFVRETIQNAKTIEFVANELNGRKMDDILTYATNIETLKIFNQITQRGNCGDSWHKTTYHLLKTIQWDTGIRYNRYELLSLLENNPGIENIKAKTNILNVLTFIEINQLSLKLLVLNITNDDMDDILSIFKEIKALEGKHFERLHLTFSNQSILTNHIDDMKSLCRLERINYQGIYHSWIGRISNLKELYVEEMMIGIYAAKRLKSLEKLHVKNVNLNAIVPFICRCPEMKTIIVENVTESLNFNIEELNHGRMLGAERVTIYVPEEFYLEMKSNSRLATWMEFQRIESAPLDV